MELSIGTARILKKLQDGETVPFSKLKDSLFRVLLEEKILIVQVKGRRHRMAYAPSSALLSGYLNNRFHITNITDYILSLENGIHSRTESIALTTNSKSTKARTFKGFLLNTLEPLEATLDGERWILSPSPGSFTFVYDFESFRIPEDITVVGIENPENFRHIERQRYLFDSIRPLFISRYPQEQHKDMIRWLQSLPNRYLHFGDFDYAGICVYQNEFKKYLEERAEFLVPEQIFQLWPRYANSDLYDRQLHLRKQIRIEEPGIARLLEWIDTSHKGLEQEILIRELIKREA